jgi:hypothetical protein
MENLPGGVLGIALVVIGVLVAIKAVKTVVKLAMLAVIGIGVYLLFFADHGA